MHPGTPKHLYEYPRELIRVRCDQCKCVGRYKKWRPMQVWEPVVISTLCAG